MGNLSTPKSVQKLQKALHAKAKAEAGYRFYAMYDKISREDILVHAYAQCRSNKGAPGVDGQEFADIEAYGVQRWLGELALALRQETYRPAPIRRVFIPKANGKLRPLGISTLRDRVCMTAAMLVLEPIFEADLPPEQYAYRPGRNAQQAVVEVGGLLHRGHPEVVDADLADYLDDGDRKWIADFTYVWTAEGWLYVAAVVDLFSRRVVGWSMSAEMTAQLVTDALVMAIWRRGKPDALLHHSDRGSQYTSEQFQRLMTDHGVVCSMSRSGNVWDNAAMESFFSSLKTERTARKMYRTRNEAKADVFDYIECFYNRKRRHSTIGYLSPVEFEKQMKLA